MPHSSPAGPRSILANHHRLNRLMVTAMSIGLLLFLTGCGGGSPDSTTKKLMNAIQDGDVSGVAALLPPDSMMATEHGEAMRFREAAQIVEQFRTHEGISSFKILDKKEQDIFGDLADYEVEVTCIEEIEVPQDEGDPKKEKIELEVTVELVQYKGRWRVVDVTSRRDN